MFNEEITSCLLILLAFIVLVTFTIYWTLNSKIKESPVLKYQKIDLLNGDITILSVPEFEREMTRLMENDYDLSSLNELHSFVEHRIKLPEKSFVILMEYDVSCAVQLLTIELLIHNINIIFFKPLLQKATMQQ